MRPFTTILILILLLEAPYWLYLPVLLFGAIAFPFYWEAIVFGVLIDTLYGVPGGFIPYPFAIGSAVALAISIPIRDRIRLHA